MKKLFFLLMICPLMMITSCKDNANSNVSADSVEALIDQEIEATNKQFPMQVDAATTLVSMSRQGDIVKYDYIIDESAVDFETFKAGKDSFKDRLKNDIIVLCLPSSELRAFFTLLRDSGKVLRYEYKGNPSGQTMSIDFSNDELHDIVKD